MKRLIPALLCICLFLTGCGSAPLREDYRRFSSQLALSDSIGFTSRLTAYYDDRLMEFTLEYGEDEDGAFVRVRSPELIRGIEARVENGGTELRYEGIILDTGPLSGRGLCPMSALPVIVDAMRNGHGESFRREGGCTVVELIPEDDTLVTIWFEQDGMTPVRAEILCSGQLKVSCTIENWR